MKAEWSSNQGATSMVDLSSSTTRFGRALACLLGLSLLGACAAMSGYPEDPQSPRSFGKPADTSALVKLRTKYFSTDVEDCYRAQDCTKLLNLTGRQNIRDDVVLNRMRVYDMEFSMFARELSSASNSISVGTDLSALVLNGLGATTGDATTKAALAAASGGVIASNGAIDKDLFYQKTIHALVTQMQANRLDAEKTILAGLAKPDANYSLQRAELDLDTLNDAGSLNSAVASITQQAASQQSQSQEKVNRYQSSVMSYTPSATTIRTWLKNGGTLDASRYKQLHDWLTNNSDSELHDVTVEELADVTDDGLESARQRAIKEVPIK